MNEDRTFRVRSSKCLVKYGSMAMEFVPLPDYRELEAQINKMKSCNNCNHHHGEECTDPDLSELTHEEYYNGCEHWRPRDAA